VVLLAVIIHVCRVIATPLLVESSAIRVTNGHERLRRRRITARSREIPTCAQ
jgi:hypothetical protein